MRVVELLGNTGVLDMGILLLFSFWRLEAKVDCVKAGKLSTSAGYQTIEHEIDQVRGLRWSTSVAGVVDGVTGNNDVCGWGQSSVSELCTRRERAMSLSVGPWGYWRTG